MGAAVASDAPAADPAAAPLASFANGEIITEKDLRQYISSRLDLGQASRNLFGVQGIVREMAMTRALNLEGPSLGVEQRAESKGLRFDDIYGFAVYSKLAAPCLAPADAAAQRAFFDATPKAFTVPTMVRLQRIMLPRTGEIEEMPVAGWLLKQITDIGAGNQTFEGAAERASKVYNSDPQGDLGWVVLDGDVSILKALADVGAGDMVGPVPEGQFIYLFRVLEKRPGRALTWNEAKDSVSRRAVSYCREQTQASWQGKMFEKYGVKIDDKAIKALFERPPADTAPPSPPSAPSR